jgi:dienelactone hydrolase
MKRLCAIVAAASSILGCTSDSESQKVAKPDGFKQIEFDATDHKKVYADFYPSTTPNSEKVILMFHQAGSNAGEYETIEPVMADLGYNCIALDQRSGGDMWGRSNRTATKSGTGNYLAAYKDLAGAVDYAHSKNYTTIIAWGSSYSSSLVFKLASEDSTIKAVISFSPGEYMDDKSIVQKWASKVTVPVFFACTPDELTDGRQQIFDAIPSDTKVLASFPDGVHGSSTLIPDKSKAASRYMDKLKAFLAALKPGS